MNTNLGKLKKRTGKKCPDCNKSLEIREINEREYLFCPACEYEEKVETKRIRRKDEEE